jgi:hypothetical protein
MRGGPETAGGRLFLIKDADPADEDAKDNHDLSLGNPPSSRRGRNKGLNPTGPVTNGSRLLGMSRNRISSLRNKKLLS